jgi:hypothetical protein
MRVEPTMMSASASWATLRVDLPKKSGCESYRSGCNEGQESRWGLSFGREPGELVAAGTAHRLHC